MAKAEQVGGGRACWALSKGGTKFLRSNARVIGKLPGRHRQVGACSSGRNLARSICRKLGGDASTKHQKQSIYRLAPFKRSPSAPLNSSHGLRDGRLAIQWNGTESRELIKTWDAAITYHRYWRRAGSCLSFRGTSSGIMRRTRSRPSLTSRSRRAHCFHAAASSPHHNDYLLLVHFFDSR